MVAAKYGKADPDMRSRKGSSRKTKEMTDKAMLKASTKVPTTGMIGGTSNERGNPSEKKGGSR